jgi:hypothetical protein
MSGRGQKDKPQAQTIHWHERRQKTMVNTVPLLDRDHGVYCTSCGPDHGVIHLWAQTIFLLSTYGLRLWNLLSKQWCLLFHLWTQTMVSTVSPMGPDHNAYCPTCTPRPWGVHCSTCGPKPWCLLSHLSAQIMVHTIPSVPLVGCAVCFRFKAKLRKTDATFFSLRSETEGFVSLVSL